MNKCEKLCTLYAKNRIEFKANKKRSCEIIMPRGEFNKKLCDRIATARKEYYDLHDYWSSWDDCFSEFDLIDIPVFKELAELWDRRRELKQEFGNIKRAIYREGVQLIMKKSLDKKRDV